MVFYGVFCRIGYAVHSALQVVGYAILVGGELGVQLQIAETALFDCRNRVANALLIFKPCNKRVSETIAARQSEIFAFHRVYNLFNVCADKLYNKLGCAPLRKQFNALAIGGHYFVNLVCERIIAIPTAKIIVGFLGIGKGYIFVFHCKLGWICHVLHATEQVIGDAVFYRRPLGDKRNITKSACGYALHFLIG